VTVTVTLLRSSSVVETLLRAGASVSATNEVLLIYVAFISFPT
jgi:hypothetical protein